MVYLSETDVFKILLVAAVVINFFTKGGPSYSAESPQGILRQTVVISLANSLMQIAKVDSAPTNEHLMYMPWGPFIQTLTRSILIVVTISWVSGTMLSFPAFQQFSPEIQRIGVALQFLFADQTAPILVDPVLKRVVFALGIAGFQMSGRDWGNSEITVWSILFNSASMTWTNVVLSILTPDTKQGVHLAITVDLIIAFVLSVLATQLSLMVFLMPYIEWYVARDITRVCRAGGADTFEVLVAAFLVSSTAAVWVQNTVNRAYVFQTLLNISAVLASNMAAEELIKRFDTNLVDVVAGSLVASMFFRPILEMLRAVMDKKADGDGDK